MQKEIDKTGEDMLYLITCALHNHTPDKDKVCEMNLTALYRYAKLGGGCLELAIIVRLPVL